MKLKAEKKFKKFFFNKTRVKKAKIVSAWQALIGRFLLAALIHVCGNASRAGEIFFTPPNDEDDVCSCK